MSRAAFLVPIVLCAAAQAQTRYFDAMEDVPLPPGFAQVDVSATFDAEAGRIITARALGAADVAQVRAFYLECLPALGWGLSPGQDSLMFRRGRQTLSLRVEREGASARLDVRLIEPAEPD